MIDAASASAADAATPASPPLRHAGSLPSRLRQPPLLIASFLAFAAAIARCFSPYAAIAPSATPLIGFQRLFAIADAAAAIAGRHDYRQSH